MKRIVALFMLLTLQSTYSQVQVPSYYQQDESLTRTLVKIIEDLELGGL